jgi:hypothetical protein
MVVNRWERNGVLLAQITQLKERGSWCGETHVQKASYFIQELTHVPLGFDFILYRHGPFSFDLRDELTELRAVAYLELEARQQPYGPSFVVTRDGRRLVEQHKEVAERFEKEMAFVVERLADKNVAELERLATALFLTLRDEKGEERDRAAGLHAVKPHISEDEALDAVRTVDRWMEEFSGLAC